MRTLVLVAYRDRQTHLDCFLLYIQKFFPNLQLAIIEQADDLAWNKGLLFNAGFQELATGYDYIVLHDIDMIPRRDFDYSPTEIPTLLATEYSQFGYGQCYPTFFGGVVGMKPEHYTLVNGFSNFFRGYGAEDDHFYRSFIAKGITPGRREGNRVECFEHPRPKNQLDYQHNLQLLETPRDFNEGLSTAIYRVVGKTISHNYIHLKVNTDVTHH